MPKISLAQWSLNRSIRTGDIKAIDFASITRNTYGLDATEYVNDFYTEHKTNAAFWTDRKRGAEGEEVRSLRIKVDEVGELGNANDATPLQTVDNHKTWVDIAAGLGGHSIHAKAFGGSDRESIKSAVIDSLGLLCAYSTRANINVIIANHALFSSDADFEVALINAVDSRGINL